MKLTAIIFLFSISTIFGQKSYLILPKSSTIEMTHKMGEDSFIDCYIESKETNEFGTYYMRIRKYSWNVNDTAYFREDDKNYYACVKPRINKEYIEIPKKPKKDQIWYNGDSTWVYTIKSINAKLSTPQKNYRKLVEIEAKQSKEKNNKLYANYLNYYSKGVGYIGSIVDGKLYSYLIEVKESK